MRPSTRVYVSSGLAVAGAAIAIADMLHNSGCSDRLSIAGWAGWILLVGASLATLATVTLDLRARRWLAAIPASVAFVALLATIGVAIVVTSMGSLCGWEWNI